MIIGFLGKGGSGKTSIATQMALFLNEKKKKILAIDADHNMDFSFNLSKGILPKISYLSEGMEDFKKGAGLSLEKEYSDAFFPLTKKRFTLSPLSKEIEKYSFLLPSFIRLMIAGPQTKNVLYGKACSHILTKPLKLLLPLLEIKENEMVLIDEKAGADGVSTGIITGIDVGIIVVEPTLHSIKTAKQISELMDFYETPHIFVANKITSDEDRDFIATELGHEPTMFFMESTSIKRNPFIKVADWRKALETVEKTARKKTQYNRLERTIQKFKRNQAFSQK